MANRTANIATSTFCALLFVLVALAASPSAPGAQASACGRWGDTNPESIANGEARKSILCLLNNERQKAGLKQLDHNKRLQKAAQRHNDKMNGTGCFDHQCAGEGALTTRLASVGYLAGGLTQWSVGENIAWGMKQQGTPEAIVDMWMHSAPHRANILSPAFDELGVGFSDGTPGNKSGHGGIYTTDFGLRRG